jgi:hypothetical protein
MLLIFGMTTRMKVLGRETIHCPKCGVDRVGALKQARRWFSLFFIPLIPLKVLGELIQCETCGTTFGADVRSLPTSAALATELLEATREATALLLRIDDPASAREVARQVLSEVAGRPWSAEELDADIEHNTAAHLSARLHRLSGGMNTLGSEHFLATIASVGTSEGNVRPETRAALTSIAADLGMTPAHARGVVEQALEASRGV